MNREELVRLYNETLSVLGDPELKRYNLHTAKNFIIHYDEITGSDKNEIGDGLKRYLLHIRKINYPESNDVTIELYNEYLSSLAIYYSRVGFITHLSYSTYFFIIILTVPFLFLLELSWIWTICLVLFLFAHWLRVWLKSRQNKVFGPRY